MCPVDCATIGKVLNLVSRIRAKVRCVVHGISRAQAEVADRKPAPASKESRRRSVDHLRWLEWEWLSGPEEFDVRERGPLPASVTRLRLERDMDLHLVVTATGREDDPDAYRRLLRAERDSPAPKAGELISRPDDVVGNRDGHKITVSGVNVRNTHRSGFPGTPGGASVRVDAQAFGATLSERDAASTKCTEWLVNFDFHPFFPSRATDREQTQHFKRTRQGGRPFEWDAPSHSGSRDHSGARIDIGGTRLDLRFGVVPDGLAPKELKPGFIEYDAIPSDDDARCVRELLSFLLGRRLGYIGATSFGDDGLVCKRTAVWPGSLFVRRGIENASSPPTRDIGSQRVPYFVDEQKLGTALGSLVRAAGQVDLIHSLGLYWLGKGALLDVAAAHLGAAIESLRDDYAAGTKKLGSILLPKTEWDPVRDSLVAAFDAAVASGKAREPGSADAKRILRTKLGALNEKSSNMKYEEFFATLGLQVGEVERIALRERNMPAHGTKYASDQYPVLAMRVGALQTLFNRCVLKIAGGVETYVDYSTLGHPSRSLADPLGGPQGDGKSA